jgi:hypothetical protein
MTTLNPATVSVLLPIIRRTLPNIIANDIIGVSPMTGPTAGIFGLRNGWYGRVVFTKNHFRHFLRVYNRRTHHHPDYLHSLGYPHYKVSRRVFDFMDARDWCKDTLVPGSWVSSSNNFWFANHADYVMFKLVWGNDADV